jgi:amino acid transporter
MRNALVLTARIVYATTSYRALPELLATISRRFATPVAASVLVGLLIVRLTWVYLLATSVQNAFNDVVAVTGLLFAIFYTLTALATIVYYRGRVFTRARDAGAPRPAAHARRPVRAAILVLRHPAESDPAEADVDAEPG